MKAFTSPTQSQREIRRPTIAQPSSQNPIFFGWGPRLGA